MASNYVNCMLQRQNGEVLSATGTKHISTLYVNRAGDVMMGYDGEGLGIYYPTTGQVTDNPYYSRDVDLTISKVYSIAEDQNGNVWLQQCSLLLDHL